MILFRKYFRCSFGLLFLMLFTGGAAIKETPLPNVVIFFTDDQGYGDVGCFGAKGFATPNLDQLAKEGLKLIDFYVAATVCTPSRAALLTGSYPKRNGLHKAVLYPDSDTGLSPNEYTIAEMLKAKGYHTGMVGKWHLGHHQKFMPNAQGFDYYYGVPYSNDMDSYYYQDRDFQSPPLPIYLNTQQIESGPDQDYLTKRFTEKATEYIKRQKASPFFLYVAHVMPHVPLHVSPAFKGVSKDGIYGDVISEIDWSAGEIIKTLKEEGLFENTIFIFTSDNGPDGRNRELCTSAGPLRGMKATTWEGGQRVPAIITWPERIPANTTSDQFVTALDIMPTVAAIIGADMRRGNKMDGRDIYSFLKDPQNTAPSEDPFYYYAKNGTIEAVRKGKWKLHLSKSKGWDHQKNGAFSKELYDLKKDIGESENVIEQHPVIARELERLARDFDKRLDKETRPIGKL